VSFKQVHETQLAIISELQNLQKVVKELYLLMIKLVDETHATNTIHKDLMTVIRSASDFMAQTPTLLNSIIEMLTVEKIDSTDNNKAIAQIRVDVDAIHEFINRNSSKMENIGDTNISE